MANGANTNATGKNPIGNTGFPTIKAGSIQRVGGSNNVKTGKDLRTGGGK